MVRDEHVGKWQHRSDGSYGAAMAGLCITLQLSASVFLRDMDHGRGGRSCGHCSGQTIRGGKWLVPAHKKCDFELDTHAGLDKLPGRLLGFKAFRSWSEPESVRVNALRA